MDNAKVKNIVIILLVIADLFLLILVGGESYKRFEEQKSRVELLKDIYEDSEIEISKSINLEINPPVIYETKRNLAVEKMNISKILGKTRFEDEGAGKFYYSGSNGAADCSGSGEFNIILDGGNSSPISDYISAAKKVLNKLDIEASEFGINDKEESVPRQVTLYAAYENIHIMNLPINVYFTGGNVTTILGSRPLEISGVLSSDKEEMDCISALMSFLQYVRQTGHVCSKVEDIIHSYYNEITGLGTGILKPGWIITTDSGVFYVDSMTGKVNPNINVNQGL